VAATPESIVLVFNPASKHVIAPDAEAQYMVLPAAVATGPANSLMAEICLAG
jgi:hypothetical protein